MTAIAVPHIELPGGSLTGPEAFRRVREGMFEGVLGSTEKSWRQTADKLVRWFAGFSQAVDNKILDHVWNDGTYAAPTPFLALGTGAISDTDVAASFGGTTEANYTGYARLSVAAADMSAAATSSKTNANPLTMAACTGSSSVVIAWCSTSAGPARLAAGDVIVYGTCTSTTIDTSHTPPTVGAGNLTNSLA